MTPSRCDVHGEVFSVGDDVYDGNSVWAVVFFVLGFRFLCIELIH